MDDIEIPEFFICPISLQIMKDPVTATTGITYDRESIEHWLFNGQKNPTCPVTKKSLPKDSDLTPNHNLRRLIQAWCTQNIWRGIDRIPTPKPPLHKTQVLKLITNLLNNPQLQLNTLQKLESLTADENHKNRKCLMEARLDKAMVSFIVRCHFQCQIIGLEEALSILYLLRLSKAEMKAIFIENNLIFESLIWVLGFDYMNNNHSTMKTHAVLVLKKIIKTASHSLLERLNPNFFQTIIGLLKSTSNCISQQGINAVLQVLLEACPWGRNRILMVEAGAVFELVELELGTPERRTTELILGVLFHLCSCAAGRAQLLDHAGGIAIVSKRVLSVSPTANDRAVLILWSICRFSGNHVVLQEMLKVEAISKLCMVLQSDSATCLKKKAREILKSHFDVWKSSPCIDVPLLTKYL